LSVPLRIENQNVDIKRLMFYEFWKGNNSTIIMPQLPLILFILMAWLSERVSVGLKNLKTVISIFSTDQNLKDLLNILP